MYIIKSILYIIHVGLDFIHRYFIPKLHCIQFILRSRATIFSFKSQRIHPCMISLIVSVNRSSYFCTFYLKNSRNSSSLKNKFCFVFFSFNTCITPPPLYSLIMIFVYRCCNGQQTNKYMF